MHTSEGFLPNPLVQGADGSLYGSLAGGGALRHGIIFRITPAGAFSVVYAFTGGADGGSPRAAMVQGADGNLYGGGDDGGAFGYGTVFRITLNGGLTVLHSFAISGDNAWLPTALVQASDGNIYGTSYGGGLFNGGTVFRVSPSGAFAMLHSFTGGTDDGDGPRGLIQARDSNLYGTTDR